MVNDNKLLIGDFGFAKRPKTLNNAENESHVGTAIYMSL